MSFKCETLDDCWKAVRAFGAPEESKFTKGIQTKFAVNQHGCWRRILNRADRGQSRQIRHPENEGFSRTTQLQDETLAARPTL